MTDQRLGELLDESTTIAVVGASRHEKKAAQRIPRRLLKAGFTVIPVNPHADEILGQKTYHSLAEIPVPVDIVDVFRPSEEAADVARQAAAIGAKTLWLQMEITSDEAHGIANAAGMNFVEDTCIGVTTAEFEIQK
ncbi:MAG: CoA-binding protein [Lacisediminihabitans sp.]